MKRGFTLVELSIVLVVIGLLIGGILAAQSMVSTANVTAQVRQYQQFDVAVSNYRTKFGGLPGDTKPMGCIDNDSGLGNVCSNGIIEPYEGGGQHYLFAEAGNFWSQLSSSQMLVDGHQYVGTTHVPGVSTLL